MVSLVFYFLILSALGPIVEITCATPTNENSEQKLLLNEEQIRQRQK